MPSVYEYLEAEQIKYAIRLPANEIFQDRISYLLKRPVGRPPIEVRRFYANFTYQAGRWTKPRRVIAKVETGTISASVRPSACVQPGKLRVREMEFRPILALAPFDPLHVFLLR